MRNSLILAPLGLGMAFTLNLTSPSSVFIFFFEIILTPEMKMPWSPLDKPFKCKYYFTAKELKYKLKNLFWR